MRINDINGNIVLCSNKNMFVYTLNGRHLAEGVLSENDNHLVTSCELYQGVHGDWSPYDLIFTGHARGLVKVCTLEQYTCCRALADFMPDLEIASVRRRHMDH